MSLAGEEGAPSTPRSASRHFDFEVLDQFEVPNSPRTASQLFDFDEIEKLDPRAPEPPRSRERGLGEAESACTAGSDGEAGPWIWEVVGGIGRGGILVRSGCELASATESRRLLTGSKVQELEVVGDRLRYSLLEGDGPASGWVTPRLGEKDLLIRLPHSGPHSAPVPAQPIGARAGGDATAVPAAPAAPAGDTTEAKLGHTSSQVTPLVQQPDPARFLLDPDRCWAAKGAPKKVAIMCRDLEGNGAEVHVGPFTLVARACKAAWWECQKEAEASGVPGPEAVHWEEFVCAQHVLDQSMFHQVNMYEAVPEPFFFLVEQVAKEDEMPVVTLWLYGVRFHVRNARLKARMARVRSLLDDMLAEFEEPGYQLRLARVRDRESLTNLIRHVHKKVLSAHGFPVQGADQKRLLEVVMQLQGFMQSANRLTHELMEMSERSIEVCGHLRMKTLPNKWQGWREAHAAAASDFVGLMLLIRREGRQRFQEGMRGLWRSAGEAERDGDPQSPYHEVASRKLLSFAEMARRLCGEAASIFEAEAREEGQAERPRNTQLQASALRELALALGARLDTARLRPPPAEQSVVTGPLPAILGLSHDDFDGWPFPRWSGGWLVLPLVFLPLAYYVRNTEHLYEMLARLQARAPSVAPPPTAAREAVDPQGPEALRALFDGGGRRYSYLIFAVLAALQTLLGACGDLGWRRPLALLASSPPGPGALPSGYPMADPGDWPDSQLLFRGIWVGAEVDEERAKCQYSFQSFSRDLVGVATVLSFYAGIARSPVAQVAQEHRHVLLFVTRARWLSPRCLATPVQLFEGPKQVDSEREVLLPPYVFYEFEEDCSVSSADFLQGCPSPRAAERLDRLRSRWGYELPELLLIMLRRGLPSEFAGLSIQVLNPFVTVLFVQKIRLAEPMAKLFRDPSLHLYNFAV